MALIANSDANDWLTKIQTIYAKPNTGITTTLSVPNWQNTVISASNVNTNVINKINALLTNEFFRHAGASNVAQVSAGALAAETKKTEISNQIARFLLIDANITTSFNQSDSYSTSFTRSNSQTARDTKSFTNSNSTFSQSNSTNNISHGTPVSYATSCGQSNTRCGQTFSNRRVFSANARYANTNTPYTPGFSQSDSKSTRFSNSNSQGTYYNFAVVQGQGTISNSKTTPT